MAVAPRENVPLRAPGCANGRKITVFDTPRVGLSTQNSRTRLKSAPASVWGKTRKKVGKGQIWPNLAKFALRAATEQPQGTKRTKFDQIRLFPDFSNLSPNSSVLGDSWANSGYSGPQTPARKREKPHPRRQDNRSAPVNTYPITGTIRSSILN